MSFLFSILKPLAYISLPIFLIRQIAVSSSVGRYYARIVIYVGTMLIVGSCGVVIGLGLAFVGRSTDVNYFVARLFYAITTRSLDLKVEVEGEENLRTAPTVLMANHQSMVDVLIVGRLMPTQTAIMAKKSLQFSPLGPFMNLAGTIFIDRGNSASAFRSIDAAGENMKRNKTSLWMFPEGTRHMSDKPMMLPLKKGGFHLAINAGLPITPIVTENYWNLYRKGVFGSGTIKVRVLPPIPTTGLTVQDVGSLATRVHEQMVAALVQISPKVALEQPTVDNSSGSSESGAAPGISFSPSESMLKTKASSSSIASSSSPSLAASGRTAPSEAGTETEEDEGMILVGRPN